MKKGITIAVITLTVLLIGLTKVNATSGSVWLGEVIQSDNTWYYSSLSPIYVERQLKTYTTYMNSVQFENNFGEYGVDKFYINGYITSVDLDSYYTLCTQGDTNNGYCKISQERLSDLQLQLWLGNNSNQCKITYNIPSTPSVGQSGYLFWSAECFSDNYTTTNSIGYRVLMIDPNNGTDNSRNYYLGINRSIYFSANDSQAIINNQNQNTQEIINQNATYSDEPKEETEGKNETADYEQKEQQLMGSLDFNMTAMDNITINPNASAFVWQIADRLRNINPAIILLMTSILGMGLIKLILNR